MWFRLKLIGDSYRGGWDGSSEVFNFNFGWPPPSEAISGVVAHCGHSEVDWADGLSDMACVLVHFKIQFELSVCWFLPWFPNGPPWCWAFGLYIDHPATLLLAPLICFELDWSGSSVGLASMPTQFFVSWHSIQGLTPPPPLPSSYPFVFCLIFYHWFCCFN